MSDTRTDNLNLYAIGASSDNIGVHMITHYNYNMTLLDSYIAAHDIESIAMSDGVLTITSLDGTTYSADLGDVCAGIVAEAFSTSTSYAVGDYCIQDGALYKCTTAHTGEWSDSDFTATTVMAEIGGSSADEITYDNTTSGLTADNVQDAIDEVAASVDTIDTAIGSTDISSIGDGTITGGISQINSDLSDQSDTIGSTDISSIGDGTVTGAIDTINSDLPKYIDSTNLSFTLSNYEATADLATNVGISSDRIISIMPIATSGYSTTPPAFEYSVSTGYVTLHSSLSSGTVIIRFRVVYI